MHIIYLSKKLLGGQYLKQQLNTCSAVWHGTRIILRQVSPESNGIFDFILELYRSCAGDWRKFAVDTGVPMSEIRHFMDFAAVFLGNVGNYFVGTLCSSKGLPLY
jgi:hypothetical protein